MKSIRKRLVISFMLVILISVLILEILLINFVKQYYYKNVEDVLTNQIMISSEFYQRYFSDTSLEDNILNDVDVFWKQTPAQVQIIDLYGNVLMDSIGFISKNLEKEIDVQRALTGEKGVWVGKVDYDDATIMAVSYPLKSDNEIVGVLRFITSLRKVNSDIKRISFIFFSIGIFVIFVSGVFSIFLANSITNPIKEVTRVAEKMALGNFKVRSRKKCDDEIGKLSDTLNYMAEEIQKNDQLKNEFISSVSHEIRTPLTAIKGWSIVLNNEELQEPETIQDGLKIIEKESERLTIMVEELLDFSKFASEKIKLNKELIEIKDIIEYIEKYMRPRADRENIYFTVTYEDDILPVYIDENRIKQVLINVLDNAFKFTDSEGSVSFNTRKENNYIIMEVKDNGCGINKEDLPKVKEKFYKGKNSRSTNGIGLSISDEIVNLHGGILEIESEIYKGTTVNIKIPCERRT